MYQELAMKEKKYLKMLRMLFKYRSEINIISHL
ncbi:hypothetical protein HCUR_00853 [Holospora curviuscula]|uniref:Uncharacterized protein n=1 Tax=Holospora curviuscula TaxID=1082868 RepID=A0A2S5R8R5_9PROT|nr:hypothetical protein HCUR_00853 [Holospora curviuscula]